MSASTLGESIGPEWERAIAASADADVAHGVAGKRQRLLGGYLVAGAAGATIQFTSDLGGTSLALTGEMALGANGVLSLAGAFCTARASEKLALRVIAGSVAGLVCGQTIT